jgi:glycine oxidase
MADVVIVGGGVIGLSVARALSKRGVGRIMLVERGQVGAEASHAAGGMLAAQAEANSADAFFELACASRAMYTAWADELREETGIDIELEKTGTLYLALTAEDELELERRFRWQSEAGLPVERLSANEARELEPSLSPHVRAALRFPLDVQVENRRLIASLLSSIEMRRVRVLTNTSVEKLCIERGQITGIETTLGAIHAPHVVVASGAWASFLKTSDSRVPPVCIEPVRGQMLCFEPAENVRHVLYSPRGYIVPRLGGRLLAGSTTEHVGFDKRVTGGGIHQITTHALELAPQAILNAALVDAWAGLRPRAEDELPVIGACAEVRGLFYATGHYRNGILLAPVTGELVASHIETGNAPALLECFSPDRFQMAGIT